MPELKKDTLDNTPKPVSRPGDDRVCQKDQKPGDKNTHFKVGFFNQRSSDTVESQEKTNDVVAAITSAKASL